MSQNERGAESVVQMTIPYTIYAVSILFATPDWGRTRHYIRLLHVSGDNPLTEAEAIGRVRAMILDGWDEAGHTFSERSAVCAFNAVQKSH